jgi:hypothetical protein
MEVREIHGEANSASSQFVSSGMKKDVKLKIHQSISFKIAKSQNRK